VDLGKVFIGTTPVKVMSWSDTKIVCQLPDSVKPEEVVTSESKKKIRGIDIFVQTGEIKGYGSKFQWDPAIISIEPKEAGLGSKIQIHGRNFGKVQSSIKVKFASREPVDAALGEGVILSLIPSDISPDELKDGNLVVTVISGGVLSNEKLIRIAPEIKTIHPSATRGGAVIIRGSNFGASDKENRVVIRSNDASKPDEFDAGIISWTDEEIKIDIPGGKNTTNADIVYNVTVFSGRLQSNVKEIKILGVKK
jgi:hypothetical protein